MRVFISWSGELSHKVAVVLRDWLPCVIQAVEPYVSSEDIDKGARWSTDISQELDESFFGLLCITKDNITAPWITFEAGALSKSVDKSRVCPLLFGVRPSEIKGPLLQFQHALCEKEDVKKLLHSLNDACESSSLTVARLDSSFDAWWPKLEPQLSSLEADVPMEQEQISVEGTEFRMDILEEILEAVRTQQRMLSSPENLLPREYIQGLVGPSTPSRRHELLDEVFPSIPSVMDLLGRFLMQLTERLHDQDVRQLNLGELTTELEFAAQLLDKLSLDAMNLYTHGARGSTGLRWNILAAQAMREIDKRMRPEVP